MSPRLSLRRRPRHGQSDPAAGMPPRLGWRLVACVLGGGLLALSAGWPAPETGVVAALPDLTHPVLDAWAWLLASVGLALYCLAMVAGRPLTRLQLAGLAAVFGLVWQVGTTWWLFIGLNKYGELPAGWAVAAVGALGLYLAAYNVLAALLWQGLVARRVGAGDHALHPLCGAAVFAATWLLAELGRAMVMTGFPWAASGYAQLHGPWRSLVPWLGVYGTAGVAAFVAAALVLLWCGQRRLRHRLGWTGALLLAMAGLAAQDDRSFTQSAGEFDVLLLQGNVAQDGKFDPARQGEAIAWHVQALGQSFADLAIAPETALPVFEDQLPGSHWAALRERTATRGGVLLFGMPQRHGAAAHHNALLGMGGRDALLNAGPDGLFRYHKAHLVPFGEFTPWGFAWFTRLLKLPLPAFESGASEPRPLALRTRSGTVQQVAALICFEDLFGEELARRFTGALPAPTVLANASNLAWFDASPAVAQHLRIAQFRSLEFERPTVRATNTGATVVIDQQGQLLRALAPHARGTLSAVVEGRTGLTPYAWWVSRAGLWPLLAVAALVLLLVLVLGRVRALAVGAAPVSRAARPG